MRAAAVDATPPAAGFHPVNHVGRIESDLGLRQRIGECVTEVSVIGVAHRTQRAVSINDHRDHGVRAGRRRDPGQAADVLGEIGGQVRAHHRPHPAPLEGHQD